MKQYDYLIVGAGLYGAVFAQEAKKAGKKCLVIDKRGHIAGNIYTEQVEGINVHRYGAHIFHTNNKAVWQYVNQFAEFNRYTNSPVANYHGEIYNLPFNMNTFNKMWGVVTPAEAKAKIEEQKAAAGITDPQNLEEQAISLVGTDIYEKLIKGYTGKQWGRPCTCLLYTSPCTARLFPQTGTACAVIILEVRMAQSKENTNVSARGKAAAANQNAGAPAAQTGEKRPRTTRRPYYNRRPRRPQQPREAAVPIHIYPLGGLGEVGKNMTVYEDVYKRQVFGKPHSEEDAKRMLRALSGATHEVHTGVCI